MKKFIKLIISSLAFSLSSLVADEPFIAIGPTTKIVYSQVVISGFTVTKATATVSETNSEGVITVRRMTQVVVPDGDGGFVKTVTQETIVVTPNPGNLSVFSVETTTDVLTTHLDGSQNPTGATTTTSSSTSETDIPENELQLPPVTTFAPLKKDLDTPVVISPA